MSAGYAFVPLPDRVERHQRPEAVFDRAVPGTLSGTLHVQYHCEQPVHVGSGFKRLHGTRVLRTAVRIQDTLGIPGSSLKGVLRSRFEAITYSCATTPRVNWDIRSQSTNIKRARFSDGALKLPALTGCCCPDWLCPACALFGCMSQRSRVSVADFCTLTPGEFHTFEVPEQFEPNIHHVGKPQVVIDDRSRDRSEIFEVRSLYGRKFALGQGPRTSEPKLQLVEVIPAGRVLAGQIRFINVRSAELGGLMTALGQTPPSKLKLGAAKCYGLGRLTLHALSVRLRGQPSESARSDEEGWRAAFVADSKYRFPQGEESLVRLHQGAC